MPVRIIDTIIDVRGQGLGFYDRDAVFQKYEALHPGARVELDIDDATLDVVAVRVSQRVPVDHAA